MRGQIVPALLITGFLAERFLFSYYFSYFVAGLSLILLALRPSGRDIITIFALFLLAAGSGLSIISIELRYIIFAILFMVGARTWRFDPHLFFALQATFLLLTFTRPDVAPERFVFGTAVSAMLVLLAWKGSTRSLTRILYERFLFLISIFVPILGFGSRAALAIWLVVNWRLTVVSMPIAVISAGLLINSTILDIPVLDKLMNSIDELFGSSTSWSETQLRTIEGFYFGEWFSTAPVWQLFIGSGYEGALPGRIIGIPAGDFSYIPHSSFLGVIFQFGLAGLSLIAWRLILLVRSQRYGLQMTILAFSLLIVGFAVKHGFFDTDLVMIFATLNYIAAKRSSPQAPASMTHPGLRSSR